MKSHVFCDFVLTVHVFFTELFFDYDQSGRRGHLKNLFTRRSRLDIRKFAFSNRIVDRWNSLSIWGSMKISRRNPCSPFFSVSYSINRHKII